MYVLHTAGAHPAGVYEYQISYGVKLSDNENPTVKMYIENDSQKGHRVKRTSSSDINGNLEIEFPYCQNKACREVTVKCLLTVKPGFTVQHYPDTVITKRRLLTTDQGSVRTFQKADDLNVCSGITVPIIISDWVCRGPTCNGQTQLDEYGIYTASSSQTVLFNGNVFVRVSPDERRSLRCVFFFSCHEYISQFKLLYYFQDLKMGSVEVFKLF